MMWSKEINKAWGTCRNKYFRGKKEVRTDGYFRNEAVTYHTLALKSYDEGIKKCPHCGSSVVDLDTLETRVDYEDYGTMTTIPPSQPYIVTVCTCMTCQKDRVIYNRCNGEVVMMYDTPR